MRKHNIASESAVTRKRANRKLTVGIDLGDRSSRYCMLDEEGEVLAEGSLATTKKGFAQVFGSKPRSRVALEVGTHSPWVSRYVADLGHEVIVANARRVRLISDSTRKDDRLDAKTLARLVRIDPELLSPIRHRSAQAQADLIVIRARALLVEARTMLVNAMRGLTKSYGERLGTCAAGQVREELAKSLSEPLQNALKPFLAEVESVSERIREVEYYRQLLLDLGNPLKTSNPLVLSIFTDAQSKLRKPTNLKALTTAIDKLDWFSAREGGLGNLYEGLLEKNAAEKKSGAGQYFTPRPLIDCMVRLVKPQPGRWRQENPSLRIEGIVNSFVIGGL